MPGSPVIRLYGYFAVIAALPMAWLIANSTISPDLFMLWLFGFPPACLLDFALRKRVPAPKSVADRVRVISFIVWSPSILLIPMTLDEMPNIWLQGPDTSYSRGKLTPMIGEEGMKSIRDVYYFVDPTFGGASFAYLRFDFNDGVDVPGLLAHHGTASQIDKRGCQGPYMAHPEWWVRPAPENSIGYTLPSARLCIDRDLHRAFLYWAGH